MDFQHIPRQKGVTKIVSGNILIAEPFMPDEHFARTVVLVCEHNADGTVGFILNRSTKLSLIDILPDINGNITIQEGGPVQKETLHMLHCMPRELGGVEIMPMVYWGGSFDAFIDLLGNGMIEERNVRFLSGYSGWSPGQLDNELKEGSWYIGKATKELIFDTDINDIWSKGICSLGNEFKHLMHMPVNPELN